MSFIWFFTNIQKKFRRALHSLTLVTAYQVFVDVVKKTDQALEFYKQFSSLTNALSKGILIIEDTGLHVFSLKMFMMTFMPNITKL